MSSKTFPGQEILEFDSEKNCMMLRDGDLVKPCVNWHQYTMFVDEKGDVFRGQIEASFVATLIRLQGGQGEDMVVISHSIVHPRDMHKAFKSQGRTVAAKRLSKALNTVGFQFHVISKHENENGEGCYFSVLNAKAAEKFEPRGIHFLPAIYRKLRKLDG